MEKGSRESGGEIAAVSGLCALVGAFIGLQLFHGIIGLGLTAALGFFIGYFSYRWRDVVDAIPEAVQMTRIDLSAVWPSIVVFFKNVRSALRELFQWWFGSRRPMFYLYAFVFVFSFSRGLGHEPGEPFVFGNLPDTFSVTIIKMMALLACVSIPIECSTVFRKKWEERLPFPSYASGVRTLGTELFETESWVDVIEFHADSLKMWWRFFLLCLKPPFVFAWFLTRFVFSKGRLLCACSASIGAGVGFAFDSVFIGTLAGAAIGYLGWELISLRVLKPRGWLMS